ncbi:uncharacterized protein Z519_03735 [Cladophialophora bantiana CBS 173.52]|uniref:Uncharacterized protein n=1 Tax=Cladophialophora bantiana (strain ATCC 10958 / CBS 173.52 / CDC B-1940 / NIH 8579) TaxID=1442370 RepID=A0A0D2EYV1_CLAB1|nr:uncharacterized protein Z519_03735 [Cladophialophora bantiana CBS 173.52]KIW95151.1 hypothetical protein Z519_03735 [Cladophialophora bantiana CBS 173.52]
MVLSQQKFQHTHPGVLVDTLLLALKLLKKNPLGTTLDVRYEQFFVDPAGSPFSTAAIHSQPKTSRIGVIFTNGPSLKHLSLILNHRMNRSIGFKTSSGGMELNGSAQRKGYVKRRAAPVLKTVMKPNVSVSPFKSKT